MNTSSCKIIGTHNGVFHCDEVVAIALLSILYDNNITVKRSRDLNILNGCDILVDIGGGKLDHHMSGGNGSRKNGFLYASAGLVWKFYGISILEKLGCKKDYINRIFANIDSNIIQSVDNIDNGVYDKSIFEYIPLFLPKWNESFDLVDTQFLSVLKITISILSQAIKDEITKVEENEIIVKLLNKKDDSNILEIPCQQISWQLPIILYNETAKSPVDFVVFPYPNGGFAAQSVPPSKDKMFEKRIPFPSSWAGETSNLPKITNVPSATFCHNNLFFARADTKEDIITLCSLAIKHFE